MTVIAVGRFDRDFVDMWFIFGYIPQRPIFACLLCNINFEDAMKFIISVGAVGELK